MKSSRKARRKVAGASPAGESPALMAQRNKRRERGEMENEIMNIVSQICDVESTNCRSLNKSDLATKLMSMANIPQNAKIQEIPLDWDNQVVILFTMPGDSNYYGLFAGIGKDLKFHFDLSIEGIIRNDNTVDFIDDPDILPVDYFKKPGGCSKAPGRKE